MLEGLADFQTPFNKLEELKAIQRTNENLQIEEAVTALYQEHNHLMEALRDIQVHPHEVLYEVIRITAIDFNNEDKSDIVRILKNIKTTNEQGILDKIDRSYIPVDKKTEYNSKVKSIIEKADTLIKKLDKNVAQRQGRKISLTPNS